jgi:hypothetical protein
MGLNQVVFMHSKKYQKQKLNHCLYKGSIWYTARLVVKLPNNETSLLQTMSWWRRRRRRRRPTVTTSGVKSLY